MDTDQGGTAIGGPHFSQPNMHAAETICRGACIYGQGLKYRSCTHMSTMM